VHRHGPSFSIQPNFLLKGIDASYSTIEITFGFSLGSTATVIITSALKGFSIITYLHQLKGTPFFVQKSLHEPLDYLRQGQYFSWF
jgi:hypothetical protein